LISKLFLNYPRSFKIYVKFGQFQLVVHQLPNDGQSLGSLIFMHQLSTSCEGMSQSILVYSVNISSIWFLPFYTSFGNYRDNYLRSQFNDLKVECIFEFIFQMTDNYFLKINYCDELPCFFLFFLKGNIQVNGFFSPLSE
jgi:hypothetical protein